MTLPATTSGRLQEDGLRRDEVASAVADVPRHSLVVRVTHWVTVFVFAALLFSGAGIVVTHPRFYWGESGSVMTKPAFTIPVPAARIEVPTRYHFVVRNYNGRFRSIHFEAAWVFVLTGLFYTVTSLWNGHFRKALFVAPVRSSWNALRDVILRYLRRAPPDDADAHSYNVAQRIAYLGVIFILTPLVIWTGLAMSPAVYAASPAIVEALGGRQTARTLHLFVSGAFVLFLIAHVSMVIVAGFKSRMRAMILGRVPEPVKRP
jgi:thiosulfate reductase cytochrome b subunit